MQKVWQILSYLAVASFFGGEKEKTGTQLLPVKRSYQRQDCGNLHEVQNGRSSQKMVRIIDPCRKVS